MIKTPTITIVCDQCEVFWTIWLAKGEKPGAWIEGDLAKRMECAGWQIGARGEHYCFECVSKSKTQKTA